MKKLTKKQPATATEDKPETQLLDGNSGQTIRIADLGACFGIEATTGTVHVVFKDRVSNLFRRSGHNVVFRDRGFDIAPDNSQAYCTIEELEEICTVVEASTREQAKEALNESENKAAAGDTGASSRLGELQPPQR